jgi:TonB family protein
VLIDDCTSRVTDGRWHRVAVPIADFVTAGDTKFDPASVFGIWLYTSGLGRRHFDLFLDDIRVGPLPGPGQSPLCRPERVDYAALPNLPEYPCDPPSTRDGGAPPDAGSILDPDAVRQTLRNAFPAFRGCYELGLAARADLGGRVTLQFSIAPDGSTRNATAVCTSLPDPAVVNCVVGAATRFRFPPSEHGAASVTYPVLLEPSR